MKAILDSGLPRTVSLVEYGKMQRYITSLVCVAVLLMTTSAEASITYNFCSITTNNILDAAAGEAQLSVVVSDALGGMNLADNQALFTFSNVGAVAMSITDVYFDDGSLFGIAGLIDADDGVGGDAGVDFTQLASPGNLPGANGASPPFVTTAGFSADSDPPVSPNGVNPGETLGILFDLIGGQTLMDVYDELASGVVRIGIHVQGFGGGGSDSFVNKPPVIPELSSLATWSLISLIVGVSLRRPTTGLVVGDDQGA